MEYRENKNRITGHESLNTASILSETIKSVGGISTDDISGASKPTNPDFFIACLLGVVAIENKNLQEDWLGQPATLDLLRQEIEAAQAQLKPGIERHSILIGAQSTIHKEWRARLRQKFQSYLKKANSQLCRECKEASGGLYESCDAGIAFIINDNNPLLTVEMVAYLWYSLKQNYRNIDCLIYANTPRMLASILYKDKSQGPGLIWAALHRENEPKLYHPAVLQAIERIEPEWRARNFALLRQGEIPVVDGEDIAQTSYGKITLIQPAN